jgi:hypothetical protein
MKIKTLQISNVLGLARADLLFNTPIMVVSGANEAGKSSIADAISMAILGKPRRVDAKKDLGQLLHDGAAKGRITITDGSGEPLGDFKLPKGDHLVSNEIKGAQYLPFVLEPALFGQITPAERRKMLFSLTNCKVSADNTEAALIKRGAVPELAAQIKPELAGGFSAAQKSAAERATQAKGAFRAVTGMNWGVNQAEGWKVEIPNGPAADPAAIASAQEKLAAVLQDIDNGNRHLGNLEQRRADAIGIAQERQRLEDLAATLKRATAKKVATEKDLNKWLPIVEKLTKELAEAKNGSVPVACPCCQADLVITGNTLAKFEGAKADPTKASQIAQELRKAQDAVTLYQNTLANDQRDIAAAENANNELAILQSEVEPVTDEQIEATTEALIALKLNESKHRAQIEALTDRQRLIEGAAEAEQKAAGHHKDVLAWDLIAKALAPDGIPADILNGALAPVNDALAILARLSGWKATVINEGMDITYGGRLYGLCSESAKWRADCLIALAIAQLSELKLIVLDRFDVLDSRSRPQMLDMLKELARLGAMDTVIICGTMKAMPAKMGAEVTGVWIEKAIAETNPQ